MNFEELKSDWEKEPSGEVNVPATVQLLKETNQPIELIRRNMKKELKWQLYALVFMGFYPFWGDMDKSFYPLFYILYTTALIISFYYGMKFYYFFKKLNDYSANSKDNFYELFYEIKLNIETYKNLSITFIPYITILFIHLWVNRFAPQNINPVTLINEKWLTFVIIIIGSSVYMYWATNWWINKFYGKSLIQLKGLLDELKEVVE